MIFFTFFSLQLSEMAADLAEEHSTATLATERLEAEQADRMKLEKDKGELEVSIFMIHSAQCGKMEIFSHIFGKNLVKSTVLLQKLLNS